MTQKRGFCRRFAGGFLGSFTDGFPAVFPAVFQRFCQQFSSGSTAVFQRFDGGFPAVCRRFSGNNASPGSTPVIAGLEQAGFKSWRGGKGGRTFSTEVCHGGDSPRKLSIWPRSDGGFGATCFTAGCKGLELFNRIRHKAGIRPQGPPTASSTARNGAGRPLPRDTTTARKGRYGPHRGRRGAVRRRPAGLRHASLAGLQGRRRRVGEAERPCLGGTFWAFFIARQAAPKYKEGASAGVGGRQWGGARSWKQNQGPVWYVARNISPLSHSRKSASPV